jgi:16S rRNA (cytosine967-C5)-methyltransferase
MENSLLRLASEIIRQSSREHPADAVLRERLKAQRGLYPAETAQVSHAVFAFYRWFGWLDSAQPLQAQLEHALQLAQRFESQPESSSDAELLARVVPGWLAAEMPITAAWARSLQAEPKLWLRAKRGHGLELAGELSRCNIFGAAPMGDTLEYQGHRDLFCTAEFHAGEFELQDLNSQAVGLICSPQPAETWWDACAGEGGKTLHLSELMGNKGLIWASDRLAWRLQRLKRRAARAKVFNYRSALWDGKAKLPTKTRFDGVLLDAPCSGIGTWQRNPHARWTTTALDLEELSELQQKLLAHAAPAVKPGGKLVYAVCTLARSETLAVVEAFEKQFPAFERLPVASPLSPNSVPAAPLYLWPQDFGGNGMFVAVWKRLS